MDMPSISGRQYVCVIRSIASFKFKKGEAERFMSEPKQTITLELTKCEVLMLQELTENMELFYKWQEEIAGSLRQKVLDAYKKPYMDATDYADLVDGTRRLWRGESVQEEMIRAKQAELEFLYDVEEINY